MNLERADPSYTAWDNAIVAKSKGRPVAKPGEPVSNQQGTPTSEHARRTEKAFNAALSHANEHEHAYDPSQRGQDDDSFGFWDFVDIINPLQHIPVVSTLYRDLTGDSISAPARIAGGMLYGGPLGFASAIGNAIVEETSGQDVGEIAMAMVFDEEAAPEPGGTAVASTNDAPAGTAESSNSLTQQVAATTVNDAARPPENAGSAAVTQMQSNNAALQALLKDMGLNQAPAPTAPPGSTALAAVPQNPVVATAAPAIAQVASAKASPEEKPAVSDLQAQRQTELPKQRKSIPIDPSRYVNTRTPTDPVATSQAAQVAATKSVLSDPALTAAQVAQTSDSERAGSSRNKDEDRAAIQSSFADRMLEGLDRYQSMTQQRSALPDVGTNGTPGAI